MEQRQKILIVDDRRENLVALKQVLSSLDADIIEATSGNQALAATLDHDFAVAILDVMMPGMNGYELAEHLRRDRKTCVIPIVFVTASYVDEQHMFDGYAAGGVDYIVKPYSAEVLLGKVRVFLEIDGYREELKRHRDRLDDLVKERTAELSERIKEIRCLYAISNLVAGPCISIKTALGEAVELIPQGWRFPEIACARVVFEGHEFSTANFRDTPWKQCADIILHGERLGGVEVGYLDEMPQRHEGSFSEEERSLLDDIARQLGVLIERERIRTREQHLNAVLRSIRGVNKLIVHEKRRSALIQGACDSMVASRGFLGVWIVLHDSASHGAEGAFAGFEERGLEEMAKRIQAGDFPPCCRFSRDSGGVTVIDSQQDECRHCPMVWVRAKSAAMNVLLRHNDVSYGYLGVFLPKAFAADPEEASLLSEIAGDLGFALYMMETEAEHERSKRFLQTIFQTVNDGLLLAETESGRFVLANNTICKMLGYSTEEINHIGVADIHPSEALDQVRSQFEKQSNGELTLAEDILVKRKDGSVFPADINASPLELEGHRYLLGAFRDVTRRKMAAEERQQLQNQLVQAQKLEAIGRLTGGIAHDFNNLLTTMLGNAELVLADMDINDGLREMIQEVMGAGERAASLIRQMLAFSRKQVLQPEVIDLNHVIGEIDKMIRRIIGEDIELKAILAPDLGQVEADVGQIEQVIMNLVVNARDAMPQGGMLTIETLNVDLDEGYAGMHVGSTPGPYVMMAVNDTGIGMTAEVRDQIFDPFFTTKEKGKGTGLGLSTVYGIVKQSNGLIWVYSEPGKGTAFKIYLPRIIGTVDSKGERSKPVKETLDGDETVLLVEDEDMVRSLAIKGLTMYGYQVLGAADGPAALRICQEHEGAIHLLITDVVMPGMGGKVLADRIKLLRPEVKVIFMSGYTDNAIVHHGVLDKGLVFLGKPFTPRELARKVRQVLDGGV